MYVLKVMKQKVRFFGPYQSVFTLILIGKLHLELAEALDFTRDMMSIGIEDAVKLFENKFGEYYELYLTEERFLEDKEDGRDVLRLGCDDWILDPKIKQQLEDINRDTSPNGDSGTPSNELQ